MFLWCRFLFVSLQGKQDTCEVSTFKTYCPLLVRLCSHHILNTWGIFIKYGKRNLEGRCRLRRFVSSK